MKLISSLLLTLSLSGAAPVAAAAQLHERPSMPAPRASVLFRAESRADDRAALVTDHGGHATTGAIVGGSVLAITGGVLAAGLCDTNESCTGSVLTYGAVGAVIGAVLGSFVGGAFH